MSVRLLRATDRIAAPWRNGGGVTQEIAASPAGATFGDFDWRVSIATVSAGGPFSHFPGIDRILTVLDGVLELSLENDPTIRLTSEMPPFAFSGDADCDGSPVGGPVTDLNVMLRRGFCSATVTRVSAFGFKPPGTCLFVALAAANASAEDTNWRLEQHDALITENDAVEWRGTGICIVIKAR